MSDNYLKSLQTFINHLNKQIDDYKKTDEYKKICEEYQKEKKQKTN
tara:strand:+ start:1508 stop:1645 length:138 start_codon:yes stop_codon:yes gene_type:complete